MEKVKLNLESIEKMLKSKDEADRIVALETIENVDFNENVVAVAFAYRSLGDASFWKDNAPKSYNKLEELNMNKSVSYGGLYDAMRSIKPPHDQVELFIRKFNEFTHSTLVDYGYDFIENMTIKIAPID